MQDKPKPVEITFQGCPPEGDGGDPVLNRLKNRVDEGQYIPVQFDAIYSLTWPKEVERRMHSEWSSQDAAEISRYEGIPVVVEGYLADAKESGAESTNCHGADEAHKDWHIWLVKSAGYKFSPSPLVSFPTGVSAARRRRTASPRPRARWRAGPPSTWPPRSAGASRSRAWRRSAVSRATR